MTYKQMDHYIPMGTLMKVCSIGRLGSLARGYNVFSDILWDNQHIAGDIVIGAVDIGLFVIFLGEERAGKAYVLTEFGAGWIAMDCLIPQ